jgi:hypothetical protein
MILNSSDTDVFPRVVTPGSDESGKTAFVNGMFAILLLLHVGFVFMMPVFPSQDGPVHLYYADVLTRLWQGTDAYGGFFTIQRLAPPYALATYLLAVLYVLVPAILAEKILISLYVLAFCLGFRWLTHSVNSRSHVASLLAFPFVLHNLLFLGFYNYSFGIAATFFVCGFWLRYHDDLTWRRSAVFAAAALVLLFTHPVTLAVTLMFLAVHLGCSAMLTVLSSPEPFRAALVQIPARYSRQLLHVLGASCLLFYPALFVTPGAVTHPVFALWQIRKQVTRLIEMTPLTPILRTPYQTVLLVTALLALLLALKGIRQQKTGWWSSRAFPTLIFAASCTVVFILAPDSMNNSALFDDRFPIFSVTFTAAAAAAATLTRRQAAVVASGVLGACVFLLYQQSDVLKPVFADAAMVTNVQPAPAGLRAVIVSDRGPGQVADLNFCPYMWMGVHYVRRSEAVLLNIPWLSPSNHLMLLGAGDRSGRDPLPMARDLTTPEGAGRLKPDLLISVDCRNHNSLAHEAAADAKLRYAGASSTGCLSLYARQPLSVTTNTTR